MTLWEQRSAIRLYWCTDGNPPFGGRPMTFAGAKVIQTFRPSNDRLNEQPLRPNKLPMQQIPRKGEPSDEELVEAYEKRLRSEKPLRSFDWIDVGGREVMIQSCQAAWRRLLKKKVQERRAEAQLTVQIDDVSADDI